MTEDAARFLEAFLGGSGSRLWPYYVPGMILLAYVVYRRQSQGGGFLRWLFPREVYFHKSHLVDIQLFVIGRLLKLFGVFQLVTVSTLVAAAIVGFAGGHVLELAMPSPVVIGLLLLVANDFATYWVHKVHHEHPTLWPFHAVHHSAEVMTPITVYRKHPFYDVFSSLIHGVFVGLVQGILLALFLGEISTPLIFGINAFYALFNAITANLRHTHVWLSFGPVLEHVFISPAQHQIHHSVEKKHYNKNYGEVLAIWDWMFGTLYVPTEQEVLTFGLGDVHGNPMEQQHPSLAAALVVPVKQSLATIRRRKAKRAKPSDLTPAE